MMRSRCCRCLLLRLLLLRLLPCAIRLNQVVLLLLRPLLALATHTASVLRNAHTNTHMLLA